MRTFLRYCWLLMLFLVLMVSSSITAIQPDPIPSRFWYVVPSTDIGADNRAAFRMVDPANAAVYETVFEIELPENTGINDAVLSPDRQWAALDTGYGPARGVYVVSLETHEIVFTGGLFLNDAPYALYTPLHQVIWSPDSQKIAFHIFILGDSPVEQQVAVYDLQRQEVTVLSDGDENQFDFVCLPDSRHLAVVTSSASNQVSKADRTWVAVVDTTTGTSRQQVALNTLSGYPAGFGDYCQTHLSPDGNHLSFWYPCHIGPRDFRTEFYVMDLTTGQVAQATAISDPPQPFVWQTIYFASEWLPDGILLIGTTYETGTRKGAQTLRYNPIAQQLSTDIDNRAMLDYALNPVTGEAAILNRTGSLAGGYHDLTASLSLYSQEGQDHSVTDIEACTISWSPDGTMLAYVIRAPYCHTPSIAAIGFMDPASGEHFLHNLPEAEYSLALGWR